MHNLSFEVSTLRIDALCHSKYEDFNFYISCFDGILQWMIYCLQETNSMATDLQTVLITGGAGFIGSHLALGIKAAYPGARVIALDNLKRRGSGLNLGRLRSGGVEFVHGDVRIPEDLPDIKGLNLILECSAEPSVLAGYGGSPRYVIDSNLIGAVHCLELARRYGAAMIFMSTSRVYPLDKLHAIALVEGEKRFDIAEHQSMAGISPAGIAEEFPINGARSLYGATKYAAEVLIAEYVSMYNMNILINRCGVIAGPWQMGRVDQGVAALWVARHIYGGSLAYIGYGGTGKQVRDMLHVDDLLALILQQITLLETLRGKVFNVGGGAANSASLVELTEFCQQITAREIPVGSDPETRAGDIPFYITDNARIQQVCAWKPEKNIPTIIEDIARWITDNHAMLQSTLNV